MAFRRAASIAALALLLSVLSVVPALAADVDVEAADFEFIPAEVSIDPGDSVTWTNTGVEPHTVTADDGSYDYWLDPGDTITHTYAEEAYEPYFCALHGDPGGLGMAGAVLVGDVEAPPPPDVTPLRAQDNVGSAIAWSQRNFPEGSDVALLGRQDLFADSLSSGGVQGLLDAPLLLTPSNHLTARTRDELRRLGVSQVILFGGNAALGPEVVDALRAEGYELSRMQGPNRVATAVNAASRLFPQADSAILARAFGEAGDETRAFADSLPAGAFAAMTRQPVLLTATRELSVETRDYLTRAGITSVTVFGGSAAVSDEVEGELASMGIDVERVAGPNRFATAAQAIFAAGPRPVVTVIDGEAPNAWAAGFPAASAGLSVLLTQANNLPPETLSLLVQFGSQGVQPLCGPFLASTLCERAGIAASAAGFESPEARTFILEGHNEVGEGDPDLNGLGAVYPTDDPGTLCYEYELVEVSEPITAAHIHKGPRGEPGPPVITLSVDFDRALEGMIVSCAFGEDPSLVSDILTNHPDYFVNAHTDTFPDGAARGQLFEVQGLLFSGMSGDQVPAGGDPDGEGFFVFAFNDHPGEACSAMFLGVSSPTVAAHIHKGPPGEPGPPVIDLRTPPQFGASFGCYAVDLELLDDIRDNPGDYFVNVHTDEFPDGAIRGQLG